MITDNRDSNYCFHHRKYDHHDTFGDIFYGDGDDFICNKCPYDNNYTFSYMMTDERDSKSYYHHSDSSYYHSNGSYYNSYCSYYNSYCSIHDSNSSYYNSNGSYFNSNSSTVSFGQIDCLRTMNLLVKSNV